MLHTPYPQETWTDYNHSGARKGLITKMEQMTQMLLQYEEVLDSELVNDHPATSNLQNAQCLKCRKALQLLGILRGYHAVLRGLARIEQSILDTNSCYNFCFMHGLHRHRQDLNQYKYNLWVHTCHSIVCVSHNCNQKNRQARRHIAPQHHSHNHLLYCQYQNSRH